MPKVLNEAEVASYRRNGYHFPIDALSASEVADFRNATKGLEVPGKVWKL